MSRRRELRGRQNLPFPSGTLSPSFLLSAFKPLFRVEPMMRTIAILAAILTVSIHSTLAAEKPLKVFILAGQSNMVGWGDSSKLPDELKSGTDRVLMFENEKWQRLRPIKKCRRIKRNWE
ncbi:MAG: sialate O-acetylesterase [Planctomycetaceae bacterium]